MGISFNPIYKEYLFASTTGNQVNLLKFNYSTK
jgi:hypothetical protein